MRQMPYCLPAFFDPWLLNTELLCFARKNLVYVAEFF